MHKKCTFYRPPFCQKGPKKVPYLDPFWPPPTGIKFCQKGLKTPTSSPDVKMEFFKGLQFPKNLMPVGQNPTRLQQRFSATRLQQRFLKRAQNPAFVKAAKKCAFFNTVARFWRTVTATIFAKTPQKRPFSDPYPRPASSFLREQFRRNPENHPSTATIF